MSCIRRAGQPTTTRYNPTPHAVHRLLTLTPLKFARQVVDELTARGASNVALLDIRGLTVIADHFVICSVETRVQMRAVRNALDRELTKDAGVHPKFEGDFADGWLLVDFGDVVVHVFSEDARAYYRLEQLWSEAPVVLHVQ